MSRTVILKGGFLTSQQVSLVADHGARVEFSPEALQKLQRGVYRLSVVEQKMGPVPLWKLADLSDDSTRKEVQDLGQLARRVLLDHAAAVGGPLATRLVRAAMLVRADVFAQGYSGVRPEVAQLFLDMLNAGVHPLVPSRGHFTIAGDTAPLAHIALVLVDGGGRCSGDSGFAFIGRHEDRAPRLEGAEAMRQAGLIRIWPTLKEAFSLVVGHSVSAGRAALLAHEAQRLWRLAVAISGLTCEAVLANMEAFDSAILGLGPGREALVQVGNLLRSWTGKSSMANSQAKSDGFSIRCLPQILGPIKTILDRSERVIQDELRAVSDNPLLIEDLRGPKCVDGGNFHGERLALALDNLRLALAEIGALSERHAFLLTNGSRSGGLPSFLIREHGLNSGFMLAQYTAAALASENKSLAAPFATDSIPTCQDYEDFAGLASHSAAATERLIANTRRILAIEMLCAAQGIDLRREEGKHPGEFTSRLTMELRRHIPMLREDTVMYRLLEQAENLCLTEGAVSKTVSRLMEQLHE